MTMSTQLGTIDRTCMGRRRFGHQSLDAGCLEGANPTERRSACNPEFARSSVSTYGERQTEPLAFAV